MFSVLLHVSTQDQPVALDEYVFKILWSTQKELPEPHEEI